MINANFEKFKGQTVGEISARVRKAIEVGELEGGDALPSIRALADLLQVHRNTVAEVYKQLARAGLVESHGRAGTRVVHRDDAPLIDDGLAAGELRDLSAGNPDPALLPDLAGPLASMPLAHKLYGSGIYVDRLAQLAVIGYEQDGYKKGDCAIVGGAMDAMEKVLNAHLLPGDAVAVEDPCFVGTLNLLKQMGLVGVGIEMDAEGMLPTGLRRALEQNVKALIWNPRAHNPTGTCTSAARQQQLAQELERHPDLLIIEDDYYYQLTSHPPRTLISTSTEKWAVIRSVSKFLGPDLRVGFAYSDNVTHARIKLRQMVGARWVSSILQNLVATLLLSPRCEIDRQKAISNYNDRRNAMISALAKNGISSMGSDGFNVWIPLANDITAMQALAAKGWLVRSGDSFRVARRCSGLRVTTSCITDEEAHAFADDLRQVLDASMKLSNV